MQSFRRLIFFLCSLICAMTFSFDYLTHADVEESWWQECYGISIFLALIYMYLRRRFYFTPTFILVGLSISGLTLPAAFYFSLDSYDNYFLKSIYLNSLALIYLLWFSTVFSLNDPPQLDWQERCLNNEKWKEFFSANRRLYFFSFPIVLLVITLTGGWSALLSLQGSDFDRIASLKGAGPLMIFSFLNVFSAIFLFLELHVNKRLGLAILLLFLSLFLNGFTHGRNNLITTIFFFLFAYGIRKGFSIKSFTYFVLVGILIVFYKITRGISAVDYTGLVLFFGHFAGDFDTLMNTGKVIEYCESVEFPGFFHIWSLLLIYIPRFFFSDKPHIIGGLHLSDLVFPGVYLGAEGGTGYSVGMPATLFAVSGLGSMIVGIGILAFILYVYDLLLHRWSRDQATPNFFLLHYLFLLSGVVILYRDGFYAFMNALFYSLVAWFFYNLVALRRVV